MKFSHFFIDRPIFASVISIVIMILGGIGYLSLPVASYPEVVPPTITVTTSYPGATPEVIMNTVASPIEQEINGVENMIYMQSQCDTTGAMSITVTFETGTDIDMAQILVQNRVSIAEPSLPTEVKNLGVNVDKKSPDMLIMANLYSADNTRDKLYITNYAITSLIDRLSRIKGVSDVAVRGGKEFSMRIWLDPDRLANLNLSPLQVVNALREQNNQVAAGALNQPPSNTGSAFELIVNVQGRLSSVDEFGEIIVKYTPEGKIIRLKDVARVELGSYIYNNNSYFKKSQNVALAFYQLPGSNALETAKLIRKELEEISKTFPAGVNYYVVLDTTEYIEESIDAVYHTIIEAIALVILVVMVFLQNWRAAIIPIFAIPVSLVGTFFVMYLFGFSLNNLSLFGLVLAVGIVVDDAIVVVENVERNMHSGLRVKEATKAAMSQVQGALIAIVLVLSCVFIPTAFISGITGAFYKQFALTIAASTIISGLVSLTLSPALCGILLKDADAKKDWFTIIWDATLGKLFHYFNVAFDWFTDKYGKFVRLLLKLSALVVIFYAFLIYGIVYFLGITPTGFIPKQDQGYLLAAIQLPDGASFFRTDATAEKISNLMDDFEGARANVAIAGFNLGTGAGASNAGALFMALENKKEREARGLDAEKLLGKTSELLRSEVKEASAFVLMPAAISGLGSGDFKFYVQDRAGLGISYVDKYTKELIQRINQLPQVAMTFTTYTVSNPQLFADIDRERAQKLNVPISTIFETLQYNLGSIYVNDFNILGRVYKVVAQAEGDSRRDIEDIYNLKVPNVLGENIPLGSLANINRIIGPDRVVRFNLYSCADVTGNLNQGYSTGEAMKAIEEVAAEVLPEGMGIDWTDLAYQEKAVGNTSIYVFIICVVFVFLLLSAQYESWSLPLAVILVVPLVLLFSVMGVYYRGMDNNIMTQIGFIVLIGLACKNAILVVEFAKQREDNGEELGSAVMHASQNRLRPILMTSFAFILGVVPLAFASGSGSELRQAIGTSVLFGMIGVTFFGLIITPTAYFVIRKLTGKKSKSN
ncbi:MAG: multidrug efflux RND transporter permease subunit [Opitutales bacterium]